MPPFKTTGGLRRSDFVLLAVFSVVLFGYSLVGGRVLSMHEARLPEASREMLADGDWLIPKCGGRPWLERPPLPHWITIAVAMVVGRCDQEWIVRIPPALMGLLSVLLVAWVAARWFTRTLGILSGLVLATMLEFLRYAWLAEEDIFLAAAVLACVALFAQGEFGAESAPARRVENFCGGRSWSVWVFFLALGLSNLVKGLLFAAVVTVAPIVAFQLWNRDWARTSRYVWLPGWLLFGAAASAWVVAVSGQYPDMLQVWFFDVANRTDGVSRTSPVWYYWITLPVLAAPWTPAALVGLSSTWRAASTVPYSPERFLWCWALAPLVVLSVPAHKHHHYLVPCLAPWAILGALGAVRIWNWIGTWSARARSPAWPILGIGLPGGIALCLVRQQLPGPAWLPYTAALILPLVVGGMSWGMAQRDGRWAAGTVFGLLTALYLTGHSYAGMYLDRYREDSAFLERVAALVPAGEPIYVNAATGNHDPFRHLFYLGDRAHVLHNLTFLLDERIIARDVFVLARYQHGAELAEYGSWTAVTESTFHQSRAPAESRWTLFQVRLRDDLPRVKNDVRFTALQAMERAPGPFLDQRR